MNATLRLLLADKKGIQKRIDSAVREEGAKVLHFRVRREMRGMREAQLDIACVDGILLPLVLSRLGKIPGVTLLSSESVDPPPSS